jgi:hypothetical protein
VATDHPGNEQVLSNDSPVLPGQSGGELVDGVLALVGDPARSLAHCSGRLAPTVRRRPMLLGRGVVRACPAGCCARQPADLTQRTVQVPRVGDLLPARKDGKGFDPEVHTDNRVRLGQSRRGPLCVDVNDTNQRPGSKRTAADITRASPASTRLTSPDASSCPLILPSRGRTACLVSQRIAPVVNRTEPLLRCLDLNLGNPAGAPLRLPVRESPQFFNDRANPSRPELNASFEHSPHHGATSPLATFHCLRSEYRHRSWFATGTGDGRQSTTAHSRKEVDSRSTGAL